MSMLENGLFCGNLEDFREMVCVCGRGWGVEVMAPVILSFDSSLVERTFFDIRKIIFF